MRFAYADPPYIGMAKHYAKEAAADGRVAAEVDHPALIERLVCDYPDGWALSLSTPTLRLLLPLCPPDTRVLSWVKPMAMFHKNVPLVYAWEPVLLRGGGKRVTERYVDFTPDWHMASRATGAWKKNNGVMGAKPLSFCLWLLRCLGYQAGDQMDDLFPGSGVMGLAARIAAGQETLPLEGTA